MHKQYNHKGIIFIGFIADIQEDSDIFIWISIPCVYYVKKWKHYYPKTVFGGIIVFFNRNRKLLLLIPGLIMLLSVMILSYGYIRRIPDIYRPFASDNISGRNTEDTDSNLQGSMPTPGNAAIEASKTNINGRIILKRYYIKCGHTYTEEQLIEKHLIGKSRDDFAQAFPDWNINEFSPDKVVLATKINSYCPDHYIIREEGGLLVIFRPDKDTGILLAVEATNIPVNMLSDDLQEQIEEGMVLNSIEEVEQLLEDWES